VNLDVDIKFHMCVVPVPSSQWFKIIHECDNGCLSSSFCVVLSCGDRGLATG
jgi:hypothetical protein